MTDQTNTPDTGITPEVGKRYVTRGGWVTPPIDKSSSEAYPYITRDNGVMYTDEGKYSKNGGHDDFDLIAEYVEPTAPPDTFRRDLVARLYCQILPQAGMMFNEEVQKHVANVACIAADTLIEAMEAQP